MSNPESFVGIDVAKSWLDVAWLAGQTLHIDYTDEAVAGLVERLRYQPPTLVVMEATGGLETAVDSALVAAGVALAAGSASATAPALH
jgi:transposase